MRRKLKNKIHAKVSGLAEGTIIYSGVRQPVPKKKLAIAALTIIVLAGLGVFALQSEFWVKDEPREIQNESVAADIAMRKALIEKGGADQFANYMVMGGHYLSEGDYRQAAEAYTKAKELRPDSPEPLLGLAQIGRLQRDKDSAIENWQAAIEIYRKQPDSDKMVKIYQQYIELAKKGDFATEPAQNDVQMPI